MIPRGRHYVILRVCSRARAGRACARSPIRARRRTYRAGCFLLSESSIKFLWLICSGITQKAERFGFCVFGLLSYYITRVLMNHLC